MFILRILFKTELKFALSFDPVRILFFIFIKNPDIPAIDD